VGTGTRRSWNAVLEQQQDGETSAQPARASPSTNAAAPCGLVDELLAGLELPREPPLFLAGHAVPRALRYSRQGEAGLGQGSVISCDDTGSTDLPVGLSWLVLPAASHFDPSTVRDLSSPQVSAFKMTLMGSRACPGIGRQVRLFPHDACALCRHLARCSFAREWASERSCMNADGTTRR
jgi:hypothetical protein